MDFSQELESFYATLEEDRKEHDKVGYITIDVRNTHGQMYVHKCCKITLFYGYETLLTVQKCRMTEDIDALERETLKAAIKEYERQKDDIWNLINSKPQSKISYTTE